MSTRKTHRSKPRSNTVHALSLPDQRRLRPNIRLIFDKCLEKLGFVPNVLRSYTIRPDKFDYFQAYNKELMVGNSGLSRLEREMIAVVVSTANHCHYCIIAHSAMVRVMSGNAMLGDQLASNYKSANLPSKQVAMLNFVWKLTKLPAEMTKNDRSLLRKAGFSDEDIFDIAEVAGFYNSTNRLASAIEAKPNPEYFKMGR